MSDAKEEAINLIRSGKEAALGTMEVLGPYVSACGYLYESPKRAGESGTLYLLLSDLARHSKNIVKNSIVSLLIVENNSNLPIHEKKRVTVKGKALLLQDSGKRESLKARYLESFPRSEIFFSLPDFRFYEVMIEEIHWIGGFGKAATLS